MIPDRVLNAFGLSGPAAQLSGGTRPAYSVGDVVLKQLHTSSLETEHSLELAPWLADHLANIDQVGFRLSSPVPSQDGEWALEDGWTAWTLVEGRPANSDNVPEAIEAIRALSDSIRHIAKHPLLDQNSTAWGVAHRYCWQGRPAQVHPVLAPLVDALNAKYQPLPLLQHQLIHGDLNVENILVAPGLTPGFIDFTPFWAPADFAIAMFANWIGPRQGDISVLHHFESVPYFDQMLLRAAVRMLLIVSELEGVDDWENAREKRAAELVLAWLP